jgi:hypothetical protein
MTLSRGNDFCWARDAELAGATNHRSKAGAAAAAASRTKRLSARLVAIVEDIFVEDGARGGCRHVGPFS